MKMWAWMDMRHARPESLRTSSGLAIFGTRQQAEKYGKLTGIAQDTYCCFRLKRIEMTDPYQVMLEDSK